MKNTIQSIKKELLILPKRRTTSSLVISLFSLTIFATTGILKKLLLYIFSLPHYS